MFSSKIAPRNTLYTVYQDSPFLRLGRLDEIERTVKKPSHVLRSIIIKIQPEKVEAPRLKGERKTEKIIKRDDASKSAGT